MRHNTEPTFANARPGELYRAPDGCLKRKPMVPVTVPVAAPAKRPQHLPETSGRSTKAKPMRGQKPVRRGPPMWLKRLQADMVARYPAFAANLPLRVGILEDLVNDDVDQKTALAFLKHWTSRTEYLAAIVTGTTRHRLDGTVDGTIPEKHKMFAAKQLKRLERS